MTQTRRGKTGTRGQELEIDFTGVQEGGKLVPEGVYLAEVAKVEKKTGNKAPYLTFEYRILTPGGSKGAIIYDNTSLSANALWRLKQVLIALGMDVPDSAMRLDLRRLKGQQAGIEVLHEDYTPKSGKGAGKTRTKSVISEIFHVSEFEEMPPEEDEEYDESEGDEETPVEDESDDEDAEDVDDEEVDDETPEDDTEEVDDEEVDEEDSDGDEDADGEEEEGSEEVLEEVEDEEPEEVETPEPPRKARRAK